MKNRQPSSGRVPGVPGVPVVPGGFGRGVPGVPGVPGGFGSFRKRLDVECAKTQGKSTSKFREFREDLARKFRECREFRGNSGKVPGEFREFRERRPETTDDSESTEKNEYRLIASNGAANQQILIRKLENAVASRNSYEHDHFIAKCLKTREIAETHLQPCIIYGISMSKPRIINKYDP